MWGLFNLTTEGMILLARDVGDADLGMYTVTMIAQDSGTPPLSDSTEVRLRVVNQTVGGLYFDQPYNYFELTEESNSFIGGGANVPIPVTGSPGAAIFSPTYVENPFNLISANQVGGA